MKKLLGIALGVLSAIGGFVDIGDLVTSSLAGARFGMSLAWVLLVGVVGICLYAEMCGRVVAVSGRPVFDLVRDRLGERAALLNLTASTLITLLTVAAELGGVALSIQLVSSVNYLLLVPVVGFLAWFVVWKLPFKIMENLFGLLGLALGAFVVALIALHPNWRALWSGASHPTVPSGEGHPTWLYYAIGLFGSAMTPYEVFFFSSGGVEEKWTVKDLGEMRINVLVGFPLGGLLSVSIMACAAVYLLPAGVTVDHLSEAALPVSAALGKLGLAVVLLGFVAATFGALLETLLSTGYTVAQYFGWTWGKFVRPARAARFHTVVLVALFVAMGVVLTSIDPVKITEYSVVLSAAALPLTYLPILVVANDRRYLGDRVNGRVTNLLASGYLVLIVVTAAVTIPLMLATKAGL